MTGTIEQLQELMNDESFAKEIAKLETNEEVQKAFEAHGIGFTMDEIKDITEKLYGDETELSEESLENVSGGFVITSTMLAIIGVATAGVSLTAGVLAEVNKNRKAQGKKTIW